MSEAILQVDGVGKKYVIGHQQRGNYIALRDVLAGACRSVQTRFSNLIRGKAGEPSGSWEEFWALRDISFKVMTGETVGIIGRNGAGKSTLLKVLSRITAPTQGRIRMSGRVASLLEVGTGFHPELTGRENVFLNGAILGMTRKEIRSKFDEIVDFAEVEKFLDTPVKYFSSGMYMRLAFAVAAHLEPEILIVDEVLAVGDLGFQEKCLGKMQGVARSGRTILFVSHNMSAVQRLCERAILLESGRLALLGSTHDVIEHYVGQFAELDGEKLWTVQETTRRKIPVRPIALRIRNHIGQTSGTVLAREPFQIEFEYELKAPLTGMVVYLMLYNSHGEPILTTSDLDNPSRFRKYRVRPAGRHLESCHIPRNLLNDGRFLLGVEVGLLSCGHIFQDLHALTLSVDATGGVGNHLQGAHSGYFRPELEWQIAEGQLAATPKKRDYKLADGRLSTMGNA